MNNSLSIQTNEPIDYQICFSAHASTLIKSFMPTSIVLYIKDIDFISDSVNSILKNLHIQLADIIQKKATFNVWYTEDSFESIALILIYKIANRFNLICTGINCSFPIILGKTIKTYNNSIEIEPEYIPYFYNHKEILDETYAPIMDKLIKQMKTTNEQIFHFIHVKQYDYFELLKVKSSLYFWIRYNIIIKNKEELDAVIRTDNENPPLFLLNYLFNQDIALFLAIYCLFSLLIVALKPGSMPTWMYSSDNLFNNVVNIIPFKNMTYYFSAIFNQNLNLSIALGYFARNLAIGIPLGIIFALSGFQGKKLIYLCIISFIMLAMMELISVVLTVGIFDVDALILRMIGIFIAINIVRIMTHFITRE